MESSLPAIPTSHEDTPADRLGRKNHSFVDNLCPDNGAGKR